MSCINGIHSLTNPTPTNGMEITSAQIQTATTALFVAPRDFTAFDFKGWQITIYLQWKMLYVWIGTRDLRTKQNVLPIQNSQLKVEKFLQHYKLFLVQLIHVSFRKSDWRVYQFRSPWVSITLYFYYVLLSAWTKIHRYGKNSNFNGEIMLIIEFPHFHRTFDLCHFLFIGPYWSISVSKI